MGYRFLKPDEKTVELILRDDNLCERYIDVLMLTQDYLSPLSSSHEGPRFDAEEANSRLNSLIAASNWPDDVRQNVEQIYREARKIMNESNGSVSLLSQVDQNATRMIDQILQIYARMRTARHVVHRSE